jgi:hypothetical protein
VVVIDTSGHYPLTPPEPRVRAYPHLSANGPIDALCPMSLRERTPWALLVRVTPAIPRIWRHLVVPAVVAYTTKESAINDPISPLKGGATILYPRAECFFLGTNIHIADPIYSHGAGTR